MKNIKLIFLILFLIGCSETTNVDNILPETIENGCYILCEGLFGQNNSTLSAIDFDDNQIINNYFNKKNGIKIGDTANDLKVLGDTSYIIVSSNNKIIAFNTKTGRLLKEIYSENLKTPRKAVKFNDSLLAISNLKGNSVTFFNIKNLEVIPNHIITGPAPEGIAVSDKYLFVANSGYGDYLSGMPDAGTIYVYNKSTLELVTKFQDLPNVIQLEYNDKSNKLYARYNNLPSLKDSLGGIVEFDVDNLKETRRWQLKVYYLSIDRNNNIIYYLNDFGIGKIDLQEDLLIDDFIQNQNTNEVWYTIYFNEITNRIFVANAKNYQSLGEILIFNPDDTNNTIIKYKVGLNPNTIVFF